MGRNKALLNWQGQPLFTFMASNLMQAGAEIALVSGGSELPECKPYPTVPDIIPGKGPISGLHAAISEIDDGCRLLVVPVDMPLLSSDLLCQLQEFSKKQSTLVFFEDFPLPVCFHVNPLLRKHLQAAIESSNHKDYSLWRLIRKLEGQTVKLSGLDQISQFRNTNTPEEWQACQQIKTF